MNTYAAERERDGMDCVDYVYSADLHRWVRRPLPPTRKDEEREEVLADAAAERRRQQREDWDSET